MHKKSNLRRREALCIGTQKTFLEMGPAGLVLCGLKSPYGEHDGFLSFGMPSPFSHYYLSSDSLGLIWGLADNQELKNRRFTNAALSSVLLCSTNHSLSGMLTLDCFLEPHSEVCP